MTARFLTIRPSLPEVQVERDQSIRQSRQRRAAAKLAKATTAAPTAEGHAEGVQGLSEFTGWYHCQFKHRGMLDGLTEREEERFRSLARAAYSNTLPDTATWIAAVRALNERHREAGIALEAAYWRSQSRQSRR
jgi:hypothetical protein